MKKVVLSCNDPIERILFMTQDGPIDEDEVEEAHMGKDNYIYAAFKRRAIVD